MENSFLGLGAPELVLLASVVILAGIAFCAVRLSRIFSPPDSDTASSKIFRTLHNRKTYAILAPLLASFVLGMVGPYSFTTDASSACTVSPICKDEPGRGVLTTTIYGFPLPVQETKTFQPLSQTHYASVRAESRSFSPFGLVLNAIFWFALLRLIGDIHSYLASRHARKNQSKNKEP